MASLLHSDSKRLYSWWWSSHISPKNSKWLQENLTDMDAKVKAMIKLIEEDADSFARRAEMYYKRRPELMKLVEEFYRAYRALAERYNHATVELRLAHRTMAEAFPEQVPESVVDDSASSSSVGETDPHLSDMWLNSRDLYDRDAAPNSSSTNNGGASKKGLKLVQDMYEFEEVTSQNFGDTDEITSRSSTITEADRCGQSLQHGLLQLSNVTKDLKMQVISESERASKAEMEVQNLKSILAEIQDEKDSMRLKYQQNVEKVTDLEKALDDAREDARGLGEQASKADIEIKILKEALAKLESERDASLSNYNRSLEMISSLEVKLSSALEKEKVEYLKLKDELSGLEAEKEADFLKYQQCLETIMALEKKISVLESEARCLSEQYKRAESEIVQLQLAVSKSNEEKEAVSDLHKQCLETLARMEGELSRAQEEAKRLNNEVLKSAANLKSAEEQCVVLEKSNQALQSETETLALKISVKDEELSQKQEEMENLQSLMQDERLRFVDIEASLKTLEKLYNQSQEEQRALTSEIRSGFKMLKELETCKHGLEEKIRRIREDNESLSAANASFLISESNLKVELSSLNVMKEKLEREYVVQATQNTTLELEIHQLREETKGLNKCYQELLSQIESVGLNPKDLATTVKDLQSENLKLKEINGRDQHKQEALSDKFENVNLISEKNVILEMCLSQLNGALEESRENVKILQESCQVLQGEKSGLVAEKIELFSRLHTLTENMESLLKKNSSLENSLSAARCEIESLKDNSRRLQEFSDLLIKEKSHVLEERSSLALQLDNVEKRFETLEKRLTDLEEKYTRLEKEKETTLCHVEELKGYLGSEKQEHETYIQSSEVRLGVLESHVSFLQDEIRLRKREFEEEIEKAVNAQVETFILQKFVEDLEAKNFSLLVECERHIEASKISKKLISELESENLEQQIETEMLSDEVTRLRAEIIQIFKSLQVISESGVKEVLFSSSYHDQLPVLHILKSIEQLKSSLSKNKDEHTRLEIENSMLSAILGAIRLDCAGLALEKSLLEQEHRIKGEGQKKLEKDQDELHETTQRLKVQLIEEGQQREALQNDLADVNEKLVRIQQAYQVLKEEISRTLTDNEVLSERLVIAANEMQNSEEENFALMHEVIYLGNLCLIYQVIAEEKNEALKGLSEQIHCIQSSKSELQKNLDVIEEEFQSKRRENLHLIESIEMMANELDRVKDLNDQLNHQILIGNDFLREKAKELSEVDQKLEFSQFSTLELCRTVQELKREHDESKMNMDNVEKQRVDLLKERDRYKEEIEALHQVNENLDNEVGILRKEIEERRIREESLSMELQKRSNEFELWEAEAASFYFDLQISSVREVLLESKVQELTEACVGLKDGSAMKSGDIAEMKKRVGLLQSEIGGLKSKLSAYAPIICSLADGMSSIKQTSNLKAEVVEAKNLVEESETEKLEGCESIAVSEMSHLQKMQERIEAIEKAVMEEMGKLKGQKYKDAPATMTDVIKETEQFKAISQSVDEHEMKEPRTHGIHLRNPLLMKDIPLDWSSDSSPRGRTSRWNSRPEDQVNELESARRDCPNPTPDDVQEQKTPSVAVDVASARQFEGAWKRSLNPSWEAEITKELAVDKTSSFTEMDNEMNRRKILERLASDSQKLTSLQASVDDLKRKAEMKKRSKKSQLVKYEMVKRQLQEVEDAVEHLLIINDHLVKNVDKNLSLADDNDAANANGLGDTNRQEVRQQATKESEKIGRLQFQVQNINFVLLKMKDQKKSRPKMGLSRSGTDVILRDFIYSGVSRGGEKKKKKSCFCGCSTPRTKGE
ncbi:hypothetical protein MLD38_039606 [Melastoma candidum]|uniref:Uncharacterized protein n=1 Tax=Melastoma candidum TaxID=119954 RepID=A0ACB9L3U0_9MYRT|nr:hypothetical protein MLD38_039606 [Melastoma candidum]